MTHKRDFRKLFTRRGLTEQSRSTKEPMSKLNYVEHEMYAVAPLPVLEGENGQFRLKIVSEKGETGWLSLTPEMFDAVEKALLSSAEKEDKK